MARANRSRAGAPGRTPSLFGHEPEPARSRSKARTRPARPPRAGRPPIVDGPGLDGPGEAAAASRLRARVALDVPVRRQFTYAVPDDLMGELEGPLRPGMRVAVPFGSARKVGVVVDVGPPTADEDATVTRRLRPVARVLDDEPIVGDELLSLTRWMAGEYACSWGEALAAVLPAGLKREKGRKRVVTLEAADGVGEAELAALEESNPKQHRLLRTLLEVGGPMEQRELLRRLNLSTSPVRTLQRKGLLVVDSVLAERDDLLDARGDDRPRHAELTPAQAEAVAAITASLESDDADQAHTFLLQGVTGSGKTEVYLRAIEHALGAGRDAIVLVPEIALTPQTVGWFRSRFERVAVLHSKMTDAQRLETWLRVRRGEAWVVVGARSALFAPVRNLGIVVVDEEHEPSFKQGSVPRYHAREVAIQRARRSGAVCVLGSATPALETWRKAREGEVARLVLPERVGGGAMPTVDVVDMRRVPPGSGLFSPELAGRLVDVLERGEQAILFQNRRGWAPVLWCPGCKTTVTCAQCDVAMAFHRHVKRLVCHSCCEELPPPRACPTCTHPGLRFLGAGSQRVEQALEKLIPSARVRRMDSDTMVRREDYEAALAAFGRGEIDVLVGTQMIAKGLDFPRVTLVGIVSADSSLHLPDFRAAERTYQLIAQVAGRAGRGELAGRIVVQTMSPEHPAIRYAARSDYEGFAHAEDELRRELGYPPHGRLARVLFEDADEARSCSAAQTCADLLRDRLGDAVRVLGPAPAPIARVRGRHRHHLLVKGSREGSGFARARDLLVEHAAELSRPRVVIDVDPASML